MAAINALLSPWCLEHTKTEAMEILQSAGVPAGAVYNAHEHCKDPYLRESGMFVTIDHPKRGPVVIPGWAVRMSDSSTQVRSAPLLGEHTEAVLSEWLGLSKQEIQEFRQPSPVAAS
jgi:formyl-CoA transferase